MLSCWLKWEERIQTTSFNRKTLKFTMIYMQPLEQSFKTAQISLKLKFPCTDHFRLDDWMQQKLAGLQFNQQCDCQTGNTQFWEHRLTRDTIPLHHFVNTGLSTAKIPNTEIKHTVNVLCSELEKRIILGPQCRKRTWNVSINMFIKRFIR